MIHEGMPAMPARERVELLAAWHRRARSDLRIRARFSRLTDEERWVLGQLVAGQIVENIAWSVHTRTELVLLQVDSIVRKLQVSSWPDAVELAHSQVPPLNG